MCAWGVYLNAFTLNLDPRFALQEIGSLTCHVVSVYGRDVKAVIEQPLQDEPIHPGRNTVSYESRLLKSLLLHLN